jgi:hypothetical protein
MPLSTFTATMTPAGVAAGAYPRCPARSMCRPATPCSRCAAPASRQQAARRRACEQAEPGADRGAFRGTARRALRFGIGVLVAPDRRRAVLSRRRIEKTLMSRSLQRARSGRAPRPRPAAGFRIYLRRCEPCCYRKRPGISSSWWGSAHPSCQHRLCCVHYQVSGDYKTGFT